MTLAQKLTTAPDHPRVAALIAAYARADAAMRDLPIYNPALSVAAYGFAPLTGEGLDGEGLIGVLITPWFMNLVLLPEAMQPYDPARSSGSRKVVLPGGARAFRQAGDATLGTIWTASLHSPMEVFKSQPQALAEARLRLAEALTPPEPDRNAPTCPSRRAFFRAGRLAH